MPKNHRNKRSAGARIIVAGLLIVLSGYALADQALIAVATNFSEVATRLEADFETVRDHSITLVTGSTGKLYAQILNGAPFDAFLAADQERPRLLEESGLAVDGSRFVYAAGVLAVWDPALEGSSEQVRLRLEQGGFGRIAMANPHLAPYGVAAMETLESLGVRDVVQDRVVFAENVGQAYAMVSTRNADLGFVAVSGILGQGKSPPGSWWRVPTNLHRPILQAAVLLSRGSGNPAARDFLDFLGEDESRKTIRSFGYVFE